MQKPTLYARTQTGAIQQWTIFYDKTSYWTEYGQVGGKIQKTKPSLVEETNAGRANARTLAQQAAFEANAQWKKKKESGYFESIEDIDQDTFVEPMLAKNYESYKSKLSFPLYSQPKLDGCRCIVTNRGMFSRNGKPFVSCPHIFEALKPLFDKDPSLVFDGELYNHELKHDFNKIMSLIKKTKPTAADLAESKRIVQYWVYDLVDCKLKFSQRQKNLLSYITDESISHVIQPVETVCVSLHAELDDLYASYMSDGYEGQMIRLDGKYENKRSKLLLKRKEFQDREYKILDVIEGVGNKAGMAGAMVFRTDDGHEFNSNIKGTREFITELWTQRKSLIGRMATVQYFNLTPDKQIPRFPYVIKIREDFDQ